MEYFTVVDHKTGRFGEVGCVLAFVGGGLYVAKTLPVELSADGNSKNSVRIFSREELKKKFPFTESEGFLPLNRVVSEEHKQPTMVQYSPGMQYTNVEELVKLPFKVTFSRSIEGGINGFPTTNMHALEFPTIKGNRNIIVAYKLPEDFRRQTAHCLKIPIVLSKGTITRRVGHSDRFSLKFDFNNRTYESPIEFTDSELSEDIKTESDGTVLGYLCGNEEESPRTLSFLPNIHLVLDLTEHLLVKLPLKNYDGNTVYKRACFIRPSSGGRINWWKLYGPLTEYSLKSAQPASTLVETPIKRKQDSVVCPGAPVKKPKRQ